MPRSRGTAATANDQQMQGEHALTTAVMAALFALPFTALVGLILLLIATAVAYANPDPDALTTPLSLGVLGLTSVLGGLISARRGQARPLLCGLFSGLLLTLTLFALSLCIGGEGNGSMTLNLPPLAAWGLHAAVVVLEMLGAKLGARRQRQ